MSSAAILAGGAASRFGGRDKSALVVGGRTILERQLHELSGVTDDILIIGTTPGEPSGLSTLKKDQIRGQATRWTSHGPASAKLPEGVRVRTVPDRVPGCGPLGGLDTALAVARDEHVFVVACDMPFVTAEFVGHLLRLAETSDIVVPETRRGYHPLCAVYTRACRALVARRLADGELAIRGLFSEARVRTVTTPEIEPFGDPDRLLANVNTPAEFGELEVQGHRE